MRAEHMRAGILLAARAAFDTDDGGVILKRLASDLRSQRFVLPSAVTLERIGLAGRARARACRRRRSNLAKNRHAAAPRPALPDTAGVGAREPHRVVDADRGAVDAGVERKGPLRRLEPHALDAHPGRREQREAARARASSQRSLSGSFERATPILRRRPPVFTVAWREVASRTPAPR